MIFKYLLQLWWLALKNLLLAPLVVLFYLQTANLNELKKLLMPVITIIEYLLFVIVVFGIINMLLFVSRKYVYYRLIPPEKGKYQLELWVSLIQHLSAESSPRGILSIFRLPPDYAITFSEKGLILSAPVHYEERVVTVLARQSGANRIFVYERIGEDFQIHFVRVVIRWIKRVFPSRIKEYKESETPVEKQVEKQAINDPTAAIVERFAEFIVQKDPAAIAYAAALEGKGKLQVAWTPLWKISVWQFPLRLLYKIKNKQGKVPDLLFVRIRIEQGKEGVMDSVLVGEELGFNWRFPLVSQYVWAWLWTRRARKGSFGNYFFEKFSVMYPQEIAIWARLPIRFPPETLSNNRLPDSLLDEAVFRIAWGEPTDDFIVRNDALCLKWREENLQEITQKKLQEDKVNEENKKNKKDKGNKVDKVDKIDKIDKINKVIQEVKEDKEDKENKENKENEKDKDLEIVEFFIEDTEGGEQNG